MWLVNELVLTFRALIMYAKAIINLIILSRVIEYTTHYYTLEKSLLIVKLRSFQNTSIEIKQISFVYQQNRFAVKKLTYKMQNENSFADKRFLLTLKRNP